jgi:nitrite reductase (NO-forming)
MSMKRLRLYVPAILLILMLLVPAVTSIALALSSQALALMDYKLPPTSYVPPGTKPTKRFVLELYRSKVVIGKDIVLESFTINGTIPGPTIIVEEGDIVELVVVNKDTLTHGLSVHAIYRATPPFIGNIPPGATKSIIFNASYPGVYMYHCAPGGHGIFMHTLFGQYGMIVVKPKTYKYKLEEILGRPPDIEIFLIQHEVYAASADFFRSQPLYILFNGYIGRYFPGGLEGPIMARPGDYVRIYFLNVGPLMVSTFHLVGIVWDFAYYQGHPLNVIVGGQSIIAGPTDSWVVEFRIPEEGPYPIVSHVFTQPPRGAIGLIQAMRTAFVYAQGPKLPVPEKPIRVINPFGLGSLDVDTPVYAEGVAVVKIIGNSYYPKRLVIPEGTTVIWINEDIISLPGVPAELVGVHDVVIGALGVKSPYLAHGQNWSYTFTLTGKSKIKKELLDMYRKFIPNVTEDAEVYTYICSLHPYMTAEIVVNPKKVPTLAAPAEAKLPPPTLAEARLSASTLLAIIILLAAIVGLGYLATIYRYGRGG